MSETRISFALKASRRNAVMAAQSMPPSTPASRARLISQKPPLLSSSSQSTTAPAAMAPTTSWPSAPILNTLARKQMDRPTAIISSGATLTPTSAQPCRSLMGSRKNTCRLASGSLPTAMKSRLPHKAVSSTASRGEHHAIRREGWARRSSISMTRLFIPEATHPAADQIKGCLTGGNGRGHAALGHHHEAIGYLEQFVQLFGNHQDSATGIAQRQE